MNRYMAAPGIMLLVLLHLQLIFHPLQQPFFLFALLLFLSAVWLMICRRIGMKLTLTLLLILLGPRRPLGMLAAEFLDLRLTMTWYAAIFATVVVSFPLMYRTARGAFEAFDETLADAGRTLGHSERWVFWRVKMPCCLQGIVAGAVLAFARALGEYGATSMICGYTPGSTATVSTTVYQLWRTGDDAGAFAWVMVNLAISAVVLLAMNWFEARGRASSAAARGAAR